MADVASYVSSAFTTLSSGVSSMFGVGASAAGSSGGGFLDTLAKAGTSVDANTLGDVGSILGVAGKIMDYRGQAQQADAYKGYTEAYRQSLALEQKRLKEKATDEYAAATRAAQEELRRGRALMSAAKAQAAASGARVDSPDVVKKFGDIKDTVDYNVLAAMYEGKTRQSNYLKEAAAARLSGQSRLSELVSRQKQAAAGARSTAIKGVVGGLSEFRQWAQRRQRANTVPWRNPDTGQITRFTS